MRDEPEIKAGEPAPAETDRLLKNEQLLRFLGDNLPDSYIYQYTREADGTPRFIYLSAGVERLTGVAAVVALADAGALLSQVDPEQWADYAAAEAASARDLTGFAMDLRTCRADGVWRWMQLRSSPLRDADGRVVWSGVVSDITERKAHERELERLNRLYAALSHVNQAIVRIRSRDELFREVTRALVESGGFKMVWIGLRNPVSEQVELAASQGDDTGYLASIRVFADDRVEGRGPTGTAVREGRPYVCNDFLNDPRTFPWREAAARAGWRSSAGFPIRQGGAVCGALTVYDREVAFFGDREVTLLAEAAGDISFGLDNLAREDLRVRTETALRLSEEKYRDIFDNAPVGIFQSSVAGRFLRVNPACAAIYGYDSPAELIRAISDISAQLFVDPDQRDEILRAVRETDAFVRREIGYRRKDGSPFVANLMMRAVRDTAGAIAFLEGFVEDITDRKRVEREMQEFNAELERRVRERTADLEAFSYSVSHDLRGPLAAVDGFTLAVLDDYGDRLDDTAQEYLGRVRRASKRMAQIIDSLLQLAKLNRATITREQVDLSALAEGIAEGLAQMAPERTVRFTIARGVTVNGDRRLLRQVMENLLGNAWKYTSHTTAAIIEFGVADQGGRPVYFVSDNGAGFEMSGADKLFRPFQRLHGESEFAGTGIGLTIVQRIVQLHGGTVWAEGERDRGARFSFTLG
ncbi:hypothetical protein GURASL_19060 [Geotalea uraniireducens]|uniref:histidine kinase n=1 Tax=Geotalea uraniireducens TaxID=351604 RepID=A0ABN6VRJ4_9BACT|nr:PAS domain S-box protein [Geotalea uraniireducens]BDV42983.1 hypothetical protein GURASL_19060 [Geotalea uraniireducens]